MEAIKITDWITALAATVSAVGVWFLWRQTQILRIQISDDHELSRRAKSVDLIMEWAKNIQRTGALARKLVETFDPDQVKKLWKQEKVFIDDDPLKEEMILGCLNDPRYNEGSAKREIHRENGKFVLSPQDSALIRWQIVSYLNVLESILAAARHGIADKEIIREQFRYLVSPTEGHYVLKNLREAVGVQFYPAILDFVEEITKETVIRKGKSPL